MDNNGTEEINEPAVPTEDNASMAEILTLLNDLKGQIVYMQQTMDKQIPVEQNAEEPEEEKADEPEEPEEKELSDDEVNDIDKMLQEN